MRFDYGERGQPDDNDIERGERGSENERKGKVEDNQDNNNIFTRRYGFLYLCPFSLGYLQLWAIR